MHLKDILVDNGLSDRFANTNYISLMDCSAISEEQTQTAGAFSSKWALYEYDSREFKAMEAHQKAWFLELYGFESENALAEHLKGCRFVLDAGAGTAYKAAWFAELSPETTVVAADISSALAPASEYYSNLDNLFFVHADIGNLACFKDNVFDYVSCDQVIHHTANPYATMKELNRVAKPKGELGIYVYRKKALPRELLDDHFREYSKNLSHDELMALSSSLTQLGKLLDDTNVSLDFPSIPALGIKGGEMSLQRFIYWNFIKCFWNEEQGEKNSTLINYDWYSPSQAARYSESEFRQWATNLELDVLYFHEEEACYSARFRKP